MRSSIACQKCRRSKVKCENEGVGTQCKSCRASGKPCVYPAPGSGTNVARRESIVANHVVSSERPNEEAPRKKRQRIAPSSSSNYISKGISDSQDDPLDPLLLTAQVWIDLFTTYERHFATDFPFLHRKTFLKPLQQAHLQSPPVVSTVSSLPVRPPHSEPFLLAFLTLTAPFHPELTSRLPLHNSSRSKGIAAAEYYADAARKQLNAGILGNKEIEKTQSLLMLGFHEWGMVQGEEAWNTLGNAMRCAQAQGLEYERELDDLPEALVKPLISDSPGGLSSKDKFTKDERKRRTFWSCFIMDRYLSCGKYRSQVFHTAKFRVQLPCSESSFNHGRRVKTKMLHESESGFLDRVRSQNKLSVQSPGQDNIEMRNKGDDAKLEYGDDEGTLSRFVRVLDLFGEVMWWSCTGGRRRETYPPWSRDSGFYKLETRLRDLKQGLPNDLVLNSSNTEDHITSGTLRNYVLMHAVLTLCTIALYREYMAFLPFRIEHPQGPLDEPRIPDHPEGIVYWESQAVECFKAAREFSDLIRVCQDWNAWVETPISGFAAYTVAFCTSYCIFFPQMDPGKFLISRREVGTGRESLDILQRMSERLFMVWQWVATYNRTKKCFIEKRKEYKAVAGSPESNTSSTDSLTRSFTDGGGGLSEYLDFEDDLKTFGFIENRTVDMAAADLRTFRHDTDPGDSSEAASPAAVKSETETPDNVPDSASQSQSSWKAVNGTPIPTKLETENTTTAVLNEHSATIATRPPVSQQPSTHASLQGGYPHDHYGTASTGMHHIANMNYSTSVGDSLYHGPPQSQMTVQDENLGFQPNYYHPGYTAMSYEQKNNYIDVMRTIPLASPDIVNFMAGTSQNFDGAPHDNSLARDWLNLVWQPNQQQP